MQAVGMKNRSSLHSIWDFVFKTRGSFSSGRGGQFAKGRRESLCSGISTSFCYDFVISCALNLQRSDFEISELLKFPFPENKAEPNV